MGNTAQSARFRGLVQVLGERHLKETAEIDMIRNEFWSLKVDSMEDFYSKFSPQDAKDILEAGNAFLLVDESVERLSQGKTACRALSRLIPAFFSSQMTLPSAHLIGPAVISLLCEDNICFDGEKGDDESDVLWAEFDEDRGGVRDSRAHDENRIEVLRLLVVALSEPLYNKGVTSGEVLQYVFEGELDSTFAEESISERATNLFISMFAVLCEASEKQTRVSATREELAQHCCNALASLLDLPIDGSNALLYVFRNLSKEHRQRIVAAIAKRVELEECVSVSSLCLLWRLLDSDASLVSQLSEDTLCSLVFSLSKALFLYRRESRTRHATVQLVSILLFSLSCDRRTGVAINKTLSSYHRSKRIPTGFHITSNEWTYADVLVCCIQKFVGDGDAALFEPLQRLVLTCLVNFSWYIKSLSATPCQVLLTMFERVARKSFLFAKETNHLYVRSLLEVFSNMLQYQSQGNSKLIYAMLRSRHIFFDLHDLDLPASIAQEESPTTAVAVEAEQEKRDEEEEKQENPAPAQGPARFVPSKEWFGDWKTKLPLAVPLLAMKELAPKVDQMVSSREEDFLELIESTTLVGALPAPQPIVISKYARTEKIDSVIRRCFWVDLLKSDDYLDLWRVPATKSTRERRTSSV